MSIPLPSTAHLQLLTSESVSSCWPQGQRSRFFDSANFDLGCAAQVFGRTSSLGGLTILQVITADPTLASFFNGLDKRAMRVESVEGGQVLLFKWASAYFDGKGTKVQGVLSRAH